MIRLQNKSGLICMFVCGILEVMAIIGAYAANYFTRTRLGMLRHMVYLNGKWEKMLPIATVKWIALFIVFALVIISCLQYSKRKRRFKADAAVTLLTIAISGWTVYFLLFYNTEMNRAYYILSLCLVLATVLQNALHYCFFSAQSRN